MFERPTKWEEIYEAPSCPWGYCNFDTDRRRTMRARASSIMFVNALLQLLVFVNVWLRLEPSQARTQRCGVQCLYELNRPRQETSRVSRAGTMHVRNYWVTLRVFRQRIANC